MQYLTAALLALAIGIEASPARLRSSGVAAPTASSGIFPTQNGAFGTGASAGFAAPTGLLARATKTTSKKASSETAATTAEGSLSASSDTSALSTLETNASSTKASSKATATTAEDGLSASSGTSAAVETNATSTKASSEAATGPAGGSLPASSGTSALSAVQTIAAGESFDGGMVMYDRGVSCTGQEEGGDSDAVFEIEEGGSLSNVIIGPNQIEGVHCFGSCTLTNVWWSAVCEDAFTIKEQTSSDTTKIIGGGAFGAEDKVLQHNGAGTMSVSGFTVESFGKLYRSCGNCKVSNERHVIFDNISATDGKSLAGINPNFGDTATFTNIVAIEVGEICVEYEGTTPGNEPEEVSSGPSSACIYSTSDVSSS